MSSLKCCEGSQDGGVGRSGDRGGQDRSVERRFCGTVAFTHYSIMQKVEQFGSSVFSVTRGFSSKGGGRNARVSQPLHAVCLVFSFLFFFLSWLTLWTAVPELSAPSPVFHLKIQKVGRGEKGNHFFNLATFKSFFVVCTE